MQCYQHEAHAVAICQGCNKGICQECVVETQEGPVACQNDTCQEKAKISHFIILRNSRILAQIDKDYRRHAIFYLLIALIFVGFGAYDYVYNKDQIIAGFLISVGAIFGIIGLLAFRRKKLSQ